MQPSQQPSHRLCIQASTYHRYECQKDETDNDNSIGESSFGSDTSSDTHSGTHTNTDSNTISITPTHPPTMRIVTEREQEKFRDYIDGELKNVQRKNVRRLAGEEGGYQSLDDLNHDLMQLVNILTYSVTQTQAQKVDPAAANTESHHLDRLAALKKYKEGVDGGSGSSESSTPVGSPMRDVTTDDEEGGGHASTSRDVTPKPDSAAAAFSAKSLSENVDNTLSGATGEACPIFDINQQQTIDFKDNSIPGNVDTSALYGQTFYLLRLADDYNSYLPHYEGSQSMFGVLGGLDKVFKEMLVGKLEGVALTQTEATRLQSIAQASRVLVASKWNETGDEVAGVYEDVMEIVA